MTVRSRAATRQVWVDRIDRFHQASQTVAQFCLTEDVSSASFYHWRRKLRSDASRPPSAKFIPLKLPATSAGPPPTVMSVDFPGGVRVRFVVTDSTSEQP